MTQSANSKSCLQSLKEKKVLTAIDFNQGLSKIGGIVGREGHVHSWKQKETGEYETAIKSRTQIHTPKLRNRLVPRANILSRREVSEQNIEGDRPELQDLLALFSLSDAECALSPTTKRKPAEAIKYLSRHIFFKAKKCSAKRNKNFSIIPLVLTRTINVHCVVAWKSKPKKCARNFLCLSPRG